MLPSRSARTGTKLKPIPGLGKSKKGAGTMKLQVIMFGVTFMAVIPEDIVKTALVMAALVVLRLAA